MAFMFVTGGGFSRVGLQVAFNGVSRTQRLPFHALSAPLEKTATAAISRQQRSLKRLKGPSELHALRLTFRPPLSAAAYGGNSSMWPGNIYLSC
jgi:hypothetical protein